MDNKSPDQSPSPTKENIKTVTSNEREKGMFLNAVQKSKTLLNDSIILNSVKDKVDILTEKSVKSPFLWYDYIVVLSLLIFLIIGATIVNEGISWRLIVIPIFIFFIGVLFAKGKSPKVDNLYDRINKHKNDPTPFKYLLMKIDHLLALQKSKKNVLEISGLMHTLFFPLVPFFLYELKYHSFAFKSILVGLSISYLILGTFWFVSFKGKLNKTNEESQQLLKYKQIISEHI